MNDEPIIKNACRCDLCGASADRHHYGFQCTANPAHVADLTVGLWTDLTPHKREDSK